GVAQSVRGLAPARRRGDNDIRARRRQERSQATSRRLWNRAVCVDDERTRFITSIGTHEQRRKGRVLVRDLENLNWRIDQWRGLYHRVPLALRLFRQLTLYLRTKRRVVSRPMVGRRPNVRLARANGMFLP